jgi:D-arabinose 1-dehydrogenase-like Zn-dependent alcohol dehydrogenase
MSPGSKIYPLTISPEKLPVSPLDLIVHGITVAGSALASTGSTRAMLKFAAKKGIKPQIEKFPMTQKGVVDAMQKLRDGKMRYRGVLVVA